MIESRLPSCRELAGLYLKGMTQEEIIKMFKADEAGTNITRQKQDIEAKIICFFKVIEVSKKAYIEYPRARITRTGLIFYATKKTLIPALSIMQVLQALEKQGWSLQEATSMDLFEKPIEK